MTFDADAIRIVIELAVILGGLVVLGWRVRGWFSRLQGSVDRATKAARKLARRYSRLRERVAVLEAHVGLRRRPTPPSTGDVP